MSLFSKITPLRLLCCIVVVLSITAAVNHIYYDVPKDEQIDLRNRIVASRTIDAGEDPYSYKWQPGDDERLLDRRVYTTDFSEFPVTFATLPPSTLLLQKPLSRLHYSTIRKLWLCIELSLLAFMITWFVFRSRDETSRLRVIITGGILSITLIWFLHLYVGQIYIIYPAILTVAYAVYSLKRNNIARLTCGFIIGISILFRPSFAVLLIPLLINKYYAVVIGAAIGIISGLSVFVLPHIPLWEGYFKAMEFWSSYNFMSHTIDWNVQPPSWLPASTEGFTAQGAPISFGNIENASVQYYAYKLFALKLNTMHLAGLYAVFLGGVFLFLKRAVFRLNITEVFLLGSGLMIASDYFLPAARMSYNGIQWAFPLFLLACKSKMQCQKTIILVLCGLALNLYPVSWINLNMWLGELLIFLGIVLCLRNRSMS